MNNEPGYQHTQRTPLCVDLFTIVGAIFVLILVWRKEPPMLWLLLPFGLLALTASFHRLTVKDQGDRLSIRFGPIPLFRRSVRYEDIEKVEVGRTLVLDGLGIHYSVRGGWVWNLWGWDCVVLHLKKGVLRVGSDDAENLARFLELKISERGMQP